MMKTDMNGIPLLAEKKDVAMKHYVEHKNMQKLLQLKRNKLQNDKTMKN